MNINRLFVVTMCVGTLLAFNEAFAQKEKKADRGEPTEEEMMKRWKDAATPGEAHKRLAEMVGSWETESTMWMNGPGSDSTITKGTAEFTMVLDGRFLRQDASGEMLGQPMSGIGYTGYDNFKRRYVAVWVDNMGTAMFTMEGTPAADGKTITYRGTMDDPMTGEKNKKVKYTETMLDNDSHVFRMYDVTAHGDKQPVLKITYRRRKQE